MARLDANATHAIGSGSRWPARALVTADAQRGIWSPVPVDSAIGGALPSARTTAPPRIARSFGSVDRVYRIQAPSDEYCGARIPASVAMVMAGPTDAFAASHGRTRSAVPAGLLASGAA